MTIPAGPIEPRYVCLPLQAPPHVDHPEDVDIAVALEIFNSTELSEEIWAANNHDPDFQT